MQFTGQCSGRDKLLNGVDESAEWVVIGGVGPVLRPFLVTDSAENRGVDAPHQRTHLLAEFVVEAVELPQAKRSYGQYCGLARVSEVVGERWGLLIVRDLLVRDQRFRDLKRGLPRIPTSVLTNRLKTLEEAGVVQRKLLSSPRNTIVYTLTEFGRDLEDIVLALGRWGAKFLDEAEPDEIVTAESLVMALRGR